jgi:hypothetical protein
MRMTRTGRNGLSLILLGMIPLSCWMAWFYTRTWVLQDVPISLSEGTHFSTGEFAANMNRRYSIQIMDEVNSSDEDPHMLPCPFGSRSKSEEKCQIGPELNMHWVLSSEGDIVQHDFREQVQVGRYVWSEIIGDFDSKRSKHYKLDIDVLSDSGSLNVTNPHVYIELSDDERMLGQLLTGLLSIVCGLLGAIGGVMVIQSFLEQRGQMGDVKATS